MNGVWAGRALALGIAFLFAMNVWIAYSRRGEIGRVTTKVGDLAPAFVLPMLDGGRRSLEEGRGHVQVLAFWATWCGPCKAELPELSRLAERLGDHARFLAINTEGAQMTAQVKDFVARTQLKLPVALDEGEVQSRYRVSLIPHLVVVDRAGRVAKVFSGVHRAEEIEDAIKAAAVTGDATSPTAP